MRKRVPETKEDPHGYLPAMGHDRLLPLYDVVTRLLGVGSLHRELVDHAGLRPGQRVLEIGCGTGNLSLLVKRRHPEVEVVALDPDPKALARAAAKAERRRLPLRLDRGFADALDYQDQHFDSVLSALMLHHLEPEQQLAALRQVRRVLRPGGSLHLVDFGGTEDPSDGFLVRRAHRHGRLRHNLGERIPQLMAEAGLEHATAVAHRVTILGRVGFYRASAGERPAVVERTSATQS